MNKSIGDILKEERISKGLAQHEVAKKVGGNRGSHIQMGTLKY